MRVSAAVPRVNFRVSFVAVQIVTAVDVRDALRQVGAQGAADVTEIVSSRVSVRWRIRLGAARRRCRVDRAIWHVRVPLSSRRGGAATATPGGRTIDVRVDALPGHLQHGFEHRWRYRAPGRQHTQFVLIQAVISMCTRVRQ